ncbi:MAG: phosphotyrosine protein phosphatase [Thermoprotei archaeon]|nr:MAG: phosphotyrosine protein phosphatase [Thermoprotei archaeon]
MAGRKRVLFVCTGNMYRSPTAEDLLKSKEGFEVKSAGTWPHAPRRVSRELIEWADVIFAMEEEHKLYITSIAPEAEGKVVVLGIPDIYDRDDPELIEVLKEKLSRHLGVKW